jgi:cell wall-associated NlpC family hydrolase
MPSFAARFGPARLTAIALAAAAILVAAGLTAGGSRDSARSAKGRGASSAGSVVSLDGAGHHAAGPPATATASAGQSDAEASQAFAESRSTAANHAAARAPHTNTASMATGVSPGAPTDAEVKRELKALQRGGAGAAGARAVLQPDGTAQAPLSAPDRVARVIAGGNEIAKFPYIWGGGHGSFVDNGYDCSGSVSYALAAGGMLRSPLDSGNLARWGAPGRGKWITIYANAGHVYMYVAGLRFDTSGRSGPRGSRWQTAPRSNAGFVLRHPPGL